MNWKRGLLRVWIIVSLLWLLMATGGAFMAFSKQEAQYKPYATKAECESDTASFRCGLDVLESVTVWHLPPLWVLVGITAVPLVLLGLGTAGYWVARGFKPSN